MLVLGMPTSVSNFYPRSPCGERRSRSGLVLRQSHFYPRSPCGERPITSRTLAAPWYISIHALLAESDVNVGTNSAGLNIISIHALLAESDQRLQSSQRQHPEFLSTLSLRRATAMIHGVTISLSISIHALLAESDCCHHSAPPLAILFLSTLSLRRATPECFGNILNGVISIHALLAESDVRCAVIANTFLNVFLSTLSLRRATRHAQSIAPLHANFYPRSPCGERQQGTKLTVADVYISIHALLAESDPAHPKQPTPPPLFLSTLSLRRATRWLRIFLHPMSYFYPRSPCGERPLTLSFWMNTRKFLSTLSLRRATAHRRPNV